MPTSQISGAFTRTLRLSGWLFSLSIQIAGCHFLSDMGQHRSQLNLRDGNAVDTAQDSAGNAGVDEVTPPPNVRKRFRGVGHDKSEQYHEEHCHNPVSPILQESESVWSGNSLHFRTRESGKLGHRLPRPVDLHFLIISIAQPLIDRQIMHQEACPSVPERRPGIHHRIYPEIMPQEDLSVNGGHYALINSTP